MTYLSQLLASLVAAPLSYGAYKLFLFFYAQWTSPLHVLPGPPNSSFIFGNMKEIWKAVGITHLSELPLIHFHTFTVGEFRLARKMGQRIWVNYHIQGFLRSKVYWKLMMIFCLMLDPDEPPIHYRHKGA
jgi:hypothetical protein